LLKPANAAQFSPDGTRILTAADDGTARVWDAHNGQQLTIVTASRSGLPLHGLLQNGQKVNSAKFSADGKRMVTAAWDQARVWDAQTGQPLTVPMQHTGSVTSAEFSSDGRLIVTLCVGSAWVWDARSGRQLTKIEPKNFPAVLNAVQFSPDGRRILTAAWDQVQVWDAESGQPLTEPLQNNFLYHF